MVHCALSIISYEPEPYFATCTCIICVPYPPHYNPCATIFYLIIFYIYPQVTLLTAHSVKINGFYLWIDSYTLYLWLYSCYYLPDWHMSGWNMSVVTVQFSYTQVYFCLCTNFMYLISAQNMEDIKPIKFFTQQDILPSSTHFIIKGTWDWIFEFTQHFIYWENLTKSKLFWKDSVWI
jgi:hypothetical protein